MKVLLIEDEYHAQKRLTNLLKELRPNIEILAIIDSVEDTVLWLKNNTAPDLMFLDIQLSDGLSFEIFTQIDLQIPVIFTTAFDEYAIKAFKTRGIRSCNK
jgi:two-component system response regulator LytT